MNRSFLIVILPAVVVGIGYVLVLHWLGLALEPFRFVIAGFVTLVAVVLVHRHQRRKSSRKDR